MSKKKVLVLGATGMLGHQVYRYFKGVSEFDVVGTCREPDRRIQKKLYGQTFPVLDLSMDWWSEQLDYIFTECGPFDYIINCIGAIKPNINEQNATSVARAILLNAEFPNLLVAYVTIHGGYIIHSSTDCVFSGHTTKSYIENDVPDATDIYGHTKILGECPEVMNIRTSIVGPEMHTKKSLLEWYLEQQGTVNGYINHVWNGLTTLQWAKTAAQIINDNLWKPGIQHIGSLPVTKTELLHIFQEEFDRVNIKTADINSIFATEEKRMVLDSIDSEYLDQLKIPSVQEQVRELVQRRYGGK